MHFLLIQEIRYQNPLKIFSHFAEQPGAIFFDSAQISQDLGRYSFIAVDPFLRINQVETTNPFTALQDYLQEFKLPAHPELPPFQGGVAGFFSYDLCQYLEKLPRHKINDLDFPEMLLGFYDLVISLDHYQQKAWIFSSGFPEKNNYLQKIRAEERCKLLIKQLADIDELTPLMPIAITAEEIVSNFSVDDYQKNVRRIIDYLDAGDVYQVNLAQRFLTTLPEKLTSFQLYRRLRQLSLAPFSAYINFGETIIASASPERFLKLTGNRVETRPIKGTRCRNADPNLDEQLAIELQQSAKDRAENLMIVDLLRNDLARVCEPHSIKVTQLCELESYSTVHHLVSVIIGKLKSKKNAVDLLAAAFPGGSVTGAPKIKAMQIIAELEPHVRGPYCGSIGYVGFNGDMDSSIVIRSFAIKNRHISFHAGAGIVADSDPVREYEETLIKAKALKEALITC